MNGSGPARHKLAALTISRAEDHFKTHVILDLDKRDVRIGESDSRRGRIVEQRAIATAVIEAVKELLDEPVGVEDVLIAEVGRTPSAIVSLQLGSRKIVGSAVVEHDEHEAVARATLSAVNRFLIRPELKVRGPEQG